MRVDRWDVINAVGLLLAGGGVWAQWGAPWACIFWGLLLLAVGSYREWRSGGAR